MKYGLSNKTVNLIKKVFKNNPAVSEVYIYGSRAQNTYNKYSDIDLAVVLEQNKTGLLGKLKIELEDLDIIQELDLIKQTDILSGLFKEEYEQTKKLFYRK